ncbi:MAG: hypothetical protein ACTHOH_11915 [Lysobacteraceae bacterium]
MTVLPKPPFRRLPRALPVALLLALAVGAHAAPSPPTPGQQAVAVETDAEALSHFDMLEALSADHPNERFRLYGQKAAATGNWVDAARNFRMAARYADKYSQHRLSLMYWHGVGVAEDRVEAYVWADIAAERGYPQFLAIREKMWAELTPPQQAAVAGRGAARYAEFGDPAAKQRFADALGHARMNVTGSRTGFVGFLGVSTPEKLRGTLPNVVDGLEVAKIHTPERNDPARYWAHEDRVWKHAIVRVGDIEDAKPIAPPPPAAPAPAPATPP